MSSSSLSPPIGIRLHPVVRYRNETWKTEDDSLAIEAPLEMRVQIEGRPARPVSITMRTPGQDRDLVLGYLFTEGILRHPDEVVSVRPEEDADRITVVLHKDARVDWSQLDRQGFASSSCGVCGKTSLDRLHVASPFTTESSDWRVSAELLRQLPNRLRDEQLLFAHSGGIHGAGLFDLTGRLLSQREDVGRHNALDKLLGSAFAQGWLPLSEHILLLSGRASFELIQKAAVAGVRLVVAVGAPSSLAVTTAEAAGLTLVGFAARHRLNVYCGTRRLRYDTSSLVH